MLSSSPVGVWRGGLVVNENETRRESYHSARRVHNAHSLRFIAALSNRSQLEQVPGKDQEKNEGPPE